MGGSDTECNDFSSCNGAVCVFVKANFLIDSILIVSMALKVSKKVIPFFFAFLFVLTFFLHVFGYHVQGVT